MTTTAQWVMPPRSRRVHDFVDGCLRIQCSSCLNLYPATREFYFFQGAGGVRGPHSWCKPCYASNSGRGKGMRVKERRTVSPPRSLTSAITSFLRLPCTAADSFTGAALLGTNVGDENAY